MRRIDSRLRLAAPPLVGELVAFEEGNGLWGARLLFEVSASQDLEEVCRLAGNSARAYAQTWAFDLDEVPELTVVEAFMDAGLAPPPLLGEFRPRIRTIARWQWGTSMFDPFDMYMFNPRLARQAAAAAEPQFLLCHGGHGISSYGLNLFVSHGPIAAYVQDLWGGAYTDPVASLERIAGTYARLREIFAGMCEEPGPVRWLLKSSGFRNESALVDLARLDAGESLDSATEAFDDRAALFQRAARLYPSQRLRNIGRSVSW